jgi:DNA-binding response OmpR family regulator
MPGTPTVLVHERSPAAQELIEQALRAKGYHVLVTNDAHEAFVLLKRIRVDLMVADSEICSEVSARADAFSLIPQTASLRVVDQPIAPVTVTPPILVAPFTLDELVDAVAQALSVEDVVTDEPPVGDGAA